MLNLHEFLMWRALPPSRPMMATSACFTAADGNGIGPIPDRIMAFLTTFAPAATSQLQSVPEPHCRDVVRIGAEFALA
jgi:hypothetical protein